MVTIKKHIDKDKAADCIAALCQKLDGLSSEVRVAGMVIAGKLRVGKDISELARAEFEASEWLSENLPL